MRYKQIKKANIVWLTVLVMLSSVLTGCGKKKVDKVDYKALYEEQTSELAESYDAIEDLKVKLRAYGEDTDDESVARLYEFNPDGSIESYNTVNNKIALKEDLKMENGYETSNNTYVSLADRLKLKVTDNWVCQFNGAKTNLSHNKGIACTIKVVQNTDGEYDPTDVKGDYLESYMKELGGDKFNYVKLYVASEIKGYEGTTTIKINRKVEEKSEEDGKTIIKKVKKKVDTTITVGVLVTEEYIVTYRITYDKTDDVAIREIVEGLVSNISYYDTPISY